MTKLDVFLTKLKHGERSEYFTLYQLIFNCLYIVKGKFCACELSITAFWSKEHRTWSMDLIFINVKGAMSISEAVFFGAWSIEHGFQSFCKLEVYIPSA